MKAVPLAVAAAMAAAMAVLARLTSSYASLVDEPPVPVSDAVVLVLAALPSAGFGLGCSPVAEVQ